MKILLDNQSFLTIQYLQLFPWNEKPYLVGSHSLVFRTLASSHTN